MADWKDNEFDVQSVDDDSEFSSLYQLQTKRSNQNCPFKNRFIFIFQSFSLFFLRTIDDMNADNTILIFN
jgi:hypothetical protein